METAGVRYGRVLEGAHIAGYTFARMQTELLWLLEGDRWREIDGAHADVNEFLRSIDLSAWKIEDRPRLVRAIKAAQPGASNRAIAAAVGVHPSTIDRVDGAAYAASGDGKKRDDRDASAANAAAGLSGEAAHRAAEKAGRRSAGKERQEDPVPADGTTARVEHGDFADVLRDVRDAAVVFTDPPYAREHLPLYERLAEWAPDVLADEGVLAVMTGQAHLPDVMAALTGRLPYRWTMAYLTPGGQAVQVFPRKVNAFWKPILLYGADRDWIGDVTRSDVNDNDKADHEWGQSVSGTVDALRRLVKVGDLVVDPMCGAGTTGVAARALGCNFVGCDITAEHVAAARARL